MTPNITSSFDFHNTQGSYIEPSQSNSIMQNSYANAVKSSKSEKHEILQTLSEVQKIIIKEISETIEKKQNELKNLIVHQIEEKISENNVLIANCFQDFATLLSTSKKVDKKQASKIIFGHFGKSVEMQLNEKSSTLRSSCRSKTSQTTNKQS